MSNEAFDLSPDDSTTNGNPNGRRSTASDDPCGCSSTVSEYLSCRTSASPDNLGGCNFSVSDNQNGNSPFSSDSHLVRCSTTSNSPTGRDFPISDGPNGWSPFVSKNHGRNSSLDLSRGSLSSAVSLSSQGSSLVEDLDFLVMFSSGDKELKLDL